MQHSYIENLTRCNNKDTLLLFVFMYMKASGSNRHQTSSLWLSSYKFSTGISQHISVSTFYTLQGKLKECHGGNEKIISILSDSK